MTWTTRINITPALLRSYTEDDLRKKAYFRAGTNGRTVFKGSYLGGSTFFTGLAIDEVLLISAECNARLNDISASLTDLNKLLKSRYDKTSYTAVSNVSTETLLGIIILERQKELVLRGIRWEDLRRLNREDRFAKTLVRDLNGTVYQLPPDDVKYVWPIPDRSIELGGYTQNPR